VTELRYQRDAGALWRDAGEHVVALPSVGGQDVFVLGGGGAIVWRLLEQPRTLEEMLADLRLEAPSDVVPRDDVQVALDELVRLGLVRPTSVVAA
jgi:hypothetical protein